MGNQAFFESKQILSSAQLLSLNTSPVLVIPGKAGCVVDVISFYMRYLPGTVQYNPADTDILLLASGVAPTTSSVILQFNGCVPFVFLDQVVDMSQWGAPTLCATPSVAAGAGVPMSTIAGAGVYIAQYNGLSTYPTGTNWTGGNGSLAVFLRYAYVEVA